MSDVGEFGLIKMLADMVAPDCDRAATTGNSGFRLTLGIGDDTAAWRTEQATELCTTDTVVEGVHFTRETTPWFDLGWKLMTANVSDIAAMGGMPLYSLVTLGLPTGTLVEEIRALYEGMLEMARKHGVAIVGGDIVRSPTCFITLSLNGAHAGAPMLRSSAKPGYQVAVTGYLGSSAGGLRLMLDSLEVEPEAADFLRNAHRRPEPCVNQGLVLSDMGVNVAMDVSDGLLDDLSKLCDASGVAADVHGDSVPVHPLLQRSFPSRALDLALNGGEDYQLLFAAPPDLIEQAMTRLGPPAAIIGEITNGSPGTVRLLDRSGQAQEIATRGWDHFK